MRPCSQLTAIAFVVLSTQPGLAQEAPPPGRMMLSEAVRLAMQHDPMLRGSAAGTAAADAAVGEARAAWFPTVALTASATQYEEPMIVNPIHGFQPGQTPAFDRTLIQFGGTVQYTVFQGGARPARVRGARARAAAADAGFVEIEQGLVARVVLAYLGALTARGILDAHDRRMAALESQRSRAHQRRDAGQAADVEVLRVEAALAQARADRVQAATALDLAERDLARLTGTRVTEVRADRLVSVTAREYDLPGRDVLLTRALQANPAVERVQREAAAAEAARAVTRSLRWPSLDVFGRYLDRGGADGNFLAEWNVGLQFTYPVFAGGAVSRAIARSDAERRAAAEHVRLVELQVAHSVDRARSALQESRARVASLETAADRYAEVVRIEVLRLDAGVGTQSDYLNAEADLLTAQAALVEARHREIAARVHLTQTTGELEAEWLAKNLELAP